MPYNLIVKEEAVMDARFAYFYYEEQLAGLGDRFIKSLKKCYAALQINPQLYRYILADKERSLRDIKLDHFPYVVIYEITGNDVVVYSVHNTFSNKHII